MDLRTYREKHNITQDFVAKKIKKHVTTVSKYESGDTMPSLKAMDSIWKLTDGAVTLQDFIKIYNKARAARNGKGSQKKNGNGNGSSSTAPVQSQSSPSSVCS